MSDLFAAQAFVAHWASVTANERAAAHSHFNALCALLGVPAPLDADPTASFYRFEKPLTKAGGGKGFADVWHRGRFAWEYKSVGKYASLDDAYKQLLLYKGDLENPPILIACDIATYRVSIEFTGYTTKTVSFTNADLINAGIRDLLRLALTRPEELRPVERAESVTVAAATQFARVAQLLERRGLAPQQTASFFMKVLFALFAEDIRLLPSELMSQSVRQAILQPASFVPVVESLFRTMRDGGYLGPGTRIPQFNGGLFDDPTAIALTADELQYLAEACRLDWSQIEPAIFGTLFERSLDPNKRAQLGAHYTSRDDILLIVEPVVMQPLRRQWEAVRTAADAAIAQAAAVSGNAARALRSAAEQSIYVMMDTLARVQVLDPACGSGNFLYVTLNALKDLEKEVWAFAGGAGLTQPDLAVSPLQLHGIERNTFASELAEVVVWIGYLQWKRVNGFWDVTEPILQKIHSIENRDAIMEVNAEGQLGSVSWPAVDYIVGNPPFLGGKRLRAELGDSYVQQLFTLYADRVPHEADLVTYWFEKARAMVETSQCTRAGLIATQAIRMGANRKVLERIKGSGDIFLAWADRAWMLDGAAVRVSMVGFDDGNETTRMHDAQRVATINADLTSALDLTTARPLPENANLIFMGDTKGGAFDIDSATAQVLLAGSNPSGRDNRDVVRPWVNGLDVTARPRGMWIIDFGVAMTEAEAAQYEAPFAYVREHVKPARDTNNRVTYRDRWWLHVEPRPALRAAMHAIPRTIVTPRVAKHRLFVFRDARTLPDSRLFVIARDDTYILGVLHSRFHEIWSLRMGAAWGRE